MDLTDGATIRHGRIDVRKLDDGSLEAWAFEPNWLLSETKLSVAEDSVTLTIGTPGVSGYYDFEVDREASGALGGKVLGSEYIDGGDYVIDRTLEGTAGPDVTAPTVGILGGAPADLSGLMPWNPIAFEFSEPVLTSELDGIAPQGMAIKPKVTGPFATGFIVDLADWSQPRSGPFGLEVHDPAGNASGPVSFQIEYQDIGPSLSLFDPDTAPPKLTFGTVKTEASSFCEAGDCTVIDWKASGGCYQPSGFAFAVAPGTTKLELRYRVLSTTDAAEQPYFFDTPDADAQYGSMPSTLEGPALTFSAAPSGSPVAFASDWITATLTLETPAAHTAFRAEIGLCSGGTTTGMPERVMLVIENVKGS